MGRPAAAVTSPAADRALSVPPALCAQAGLDRIGTASGLLRTFAYLGAILSSGLVGLSFGRTADDAGLHILAATLAALAAVLLVTTIVSRLPFRTR